MFRSSRILGVALLAAALAGCASVPSVLPVDQRDVPVGRDLVVSVPQPEIIADINASNLSAAGGGGLLLALIDSGINQSRASKAEQAIADLRDALGDYDFTRLSQDMVQSAMGELDWMQVQRTRLTTSPLDRDVVLEHLDSSPLPQVVFVDSRYSMAPDFDRLSVEWVVTIVPTAIPAGKAPESRAAASNFAYNQRFSCQVSSPLPEDAALAAQLWGANQGAEARSAAETCLVRLGEMVRVSLSLTADEYAAIRKAERVASGVLPSGMRGRLVRETPYGVMAINDLQQWVYVLKPGNRIAVRTEGGDAAVADEM